MKNYIVRFTESAKIDLDDIWFYLAEDSIENADYTIFDLQNFCTGNFSNFPELGRERDDIKKGLRYFPHKIKKVSYNIFYSIDDETVYIRHIFHSSKNYKTHF